MTRFPLLFPHVDFEIANRQRILILRPTIDVRMNTEYETTTPYCMIDTGAPLSVMSYSVGKSLHHALRPVAVTNNPLPKFQNGQPSGTVPQSSILEWDHAPTRLVELDVRLIDSVTGDQTGLLTLLAKWVQQPRQDVFNDNFILLGMHFFAANAGNLEIMTQPWGTSGSLVFP